MFLLQQSTHRMLLQYDADLGHRFVPGLRARIPNDNGGYFVVTNSSGFRSNFEFEQARQDRPRILMFGDSYTAGDNVANEDRYSDLLAERAGVEVYNYGIPGSGTDQHLLAFRKFGRQVPADLLVICVQIDSFHRIQSSHRPSVDRTTGQRLWVPKPYFELMDGRLELRQVPVPLARLPMDQQTKSEGKQEDEWLERVHELYLKIPGLKELRDSKALNEVCSRLITEVRRIRGRHPYPDIVSAATPGWKLMEAILRRFIEEARPTPVVIFPIPTRDFYEVGIKPSYQRLFARLDSPSSGVHVGDVSTLLCRLPYQTRRTLTFKTGGHFSPFAHGLVADQMQAFLVERGLLPTRSTKAAAVVVGPGAAAVRDVPGTVAAAQAGNQANVERPRSTQLSPPGRAGRRRSDSSLVLGISCFYHNSAAALIRDGKIVAAAEEERFSRLKNDRRFPRQAINYCLEEAGVSQHDLAGVGFYDNAGLTFERILHGLMAVDRDAAAKMWINVLPDWLRVKLHYPALIRRNLKYDGPIFQGVHHRSHAASCFFPSPFERAATLTIDGVGEWATASIGRGEGRKLDILKEMRFPHSLGLLYSAFTYFTGFKVNSGEYKMMGLAPYGRGKYTQQILENVVDLKSDGSIQLNMDYFAFLRDLSTTSEKFDTLFGGPRRKPESRITRREIDIARSIQEVTEEAFLRMARTARELTGEKKLCLAGGVALNCVANGHLLRAGIFDDLWIQPAAGDSGCALGVALDVWHTHFETPRPAITQGSSQGGSYLGPAFSGDEIQAYLTTSGFPYRRLSGEDRNAFLSKKLQEGLVVGHFAGRLEFGPRSLGARSILGDARNTDMQATLNLRIKYRESFRPFAPAVLNEFVSRYFELEGESPYMLIVAPVRADRRLPFDISQLDESEDLLPIVRQPRSDLPAITHVDYSARIQTVRREHHPEFYDLIRRFEQDTGVGVVVNTSFNVRGEPIVCTPQDAYRCFMRTEMDVLALGDYILLKGEQPAWPEGKGEGLESEDVTKEPAPQGDGKLATALNRVFEQDFWPVAEQIRRQGGGLVNPNQPRAESMWSDVNEPADKKSLFLLAPALLADDPDPKSFAHALIKTWHGQAAAEALEPVVARLIAAGNRFPSTAEEGEELPESVYAMF